MTEVASLLPEEIVGKAKHNPKAAMEREVMLATAHGLEMFDRIMDRAAA